MTPAPLVTWQYEQIEAECALLSGHATDPDCPCDSDTENCIRKHLLTIEALAKETYPMDISDREKQSMADLAAQARSWRKQIEDLTTGNPNGNPDSEGDRIELPTDQLLDAYNRWKALEPTGIDEIDRQREYAINLIHEELKKRDALPVDNPGQPFRIEELAGGAGQVRIYKEKGEFHVGSFRTVPAVDQAFKPDPQTLVLVGCPVDRGSWENQECICRDTGERGCMELQSVTVFKKK